MTELRCARSVFTKHDPAGKLSVTVTLHVDDGLLGRRSDTAYQMMKKLISERLDISWQGLGNPEAVDY